MSDERRGHQTPPGSPFAVGELSRSLQEQLDASVSDDDNIEDKAQSSTQEGAPTAKPEIKSDDGPWASDMERSAREQIRQTVEAMQMEEPMSGHGDLHVSHVDADLPECRRGEGDEPQVLDPDNPFMIKFQNALTNLLQRQCDKLTNESLELSADLRMKERQREELGEILYNLQDELTQIATQTENANDVISQLCCARCLIEKSLREVKQCYREKAETLEDGKKTESRLRAELLAATNLLTQLKACEQELESELSVSQGISEKTKKQKRDMCIEKRKQDIVLLRLRRAVVALARERDELVKRAESKSSDREELNCSLADASTDVQILQGEQTRLMQAWNAVIHAIAHRDCVYNNVTKDLLEAKESFNLLLSEIDKTKHACKMEMLSNERLIILLGKLQKEYNDMCTVHRRNQTRMEELECNYCHAQKMLKDTEEQYAVCQMENKQLQQISDLSFKELEQFTEEKNKLESSILELLRDQGKHDKAFNHMAKQLQDLKDSNKRQELVFVVNENNISKFLVQIEEIKGTLEIGKKELDKLNDEERAISQEIAALETLRRKTESDIYRRSQAIHHLRLKFDESTCNPAIETCSEETKLKAAEAELEDLLHKIEQKQEFWMKLQGNIVKLASDRQDQLRKLDLLYKQTQILRQRNLKLEAEMEKLNEDEGNARRDIHNLLVRVDKKCAMFHTHRKDAQNVTNVNTAVMMDLEEQLKSSERKCLELEEELSDLRQSNLLLLHEANEKKRESLNWDKKVQMIVEAKESNKESQKLEGELGGMKLEIHRMKIRLSQLRKIQETLGKDLEQCVSKRERISSLAEIREKRSVTVTSNRVVHERKMASCITKTKDAEQAIKLIKANLSRFPEKENILHAQIEDACERTREIDCCISEIDRQIEEGQVLKYQNLDEIIRRQKRAKMYTKVKEGKHCLQFRTESRLQQEYCRQRNINFNLQEVTDLLMQDFPHLRLYFRRICSTLQIKT